MPVFWHACGRSLLFRAYMMTSTLSEIAFSGLVNMMSSIFLVQVLDT